MLAPSVYSYDLVNVKVTFTGNDPKLGFQPTSDAKAVSNFFVGDGATFYKSSTLAIAWLGSFAEIGLTMPGLNVETIGKVLSVVKNGAWMASIPRAIHSTLKFCDTIVICWEAPTQKNFTKMAFAFAKTAAKVCEAVSGVTGAMGLNVVAKAWNVGKHALSMPGDWKTIDNAADEAELLHLGKDPLSSSPRYCQAQFKAHSINLMKGATAFIHHSFSFSRIYFGVAVNPFVGLAIGALFLSLSLYSYIQELRVENIRQAYLCREINEHFSEIKALDNRLCQELKAQNNWTRFDGGDTSCHSTAIRRSRVSHSFPHCKTPVYHP